LKDDTGETILDAKLDFEKNEILFVNVYAGTETRASARAWCGVGMAVAGGCGCCIYSGNARSKYWLCSMLGIGKFANVLNS